MPDQYQPDLQRAVDQRIAEHKSTLPVMPNCYGKYDSPLCRQRECHENCTEIRECVNRKHGRSILPVAASQEQRIKELEQQVETLTRERDALRDCDMAHKLEEARQAFASESRLRERFQTGYDSAVHMAAKAQEERDAAIAAKEKAERESSHAFAAFNRCEGQRYAMNRERDALQARVRELEASVAVYENTLCRRERGFRVHESGGLVKEVEQVKLGTLFRQRDALQARLDAMTSDEAVEAGCRYGDPLWNEPGFYSDKMKDETRKNIRGVINAAIKAALKDAGEKRRRIIPQNYSGVDGEVVTA